MERKRVEVERMLREEKEAATAATVNRARVLREEMARARKVGIHRELPAWLRTCF